MNAHTNIDPLADRRRQTRATLAFLDRHDAILRRTNAIVDRMLPALPQPGFSTRYPELNGTTAQYLHWERRCAERSRLHREVRARIEAKVVEPPRVLTERAWLV